MRKGVHLVSYSHVYILLHLVSRLKTSGTVPPLPDISSRHVQGQILHLLVSTICRSVTYTVYKTQKINMTCNICLVTYIWRMWVFRFYKRWLWKLLSSVMWCRVVWWICARVSEDPTSPIISVIDGDCRTLKCRLTHNRLQWVNVWNL